ADLQKTYPQSRWLSDAKALDGELRGGSGPAVRSGASDEEKEAAIRALINADPARALPMLEKLLGQSSPKIRGQALFALAQHGSPQAREILTRTAKGQANPDLQLKAIKYLGLFGGSESHQALSDIYASSSDVSLKKAILHSFMISGEKGRVLAAAKGESSPELRRDAIHQLGVMGAQEELWEMYRSETSVEMKKAMLQGMFVGGNTTRMLELAKTEKDPELRRSAIRNLGLMGASGDVL